MLLLFFVHAGCRGRILIGYHSMNEKWQITWEGIVYSFEYVLTLKIVCHWKLKEKTNLLVKIWMMVVLGLKIKYLCIPIILIEILNMWKLIIKELRKNI